MQPLLRRTKTSGIIDRIGLRVFILALCFIWFYMLWGKPVQSVCAAIGLTLLINLAIMQAEKRTVQKRENSLRQKIGGQLAVDALVYETGKSAANSVAQWISNAVPLEGCEEKESGVYGTLEGKRVYIECMRKHAASKVGKDDVVSIVRTARLLGMDIAVLCCTCQIPPDVAGYADEQAPRVRLISRDMLIRLAGVCAPATDEQLSELGSRTRGKRFDIEAFKQRILEAGKAKRYGLYGLGLFVMFLVTRQWLYAIPAAMCLALFFFSRFHRREGPLTL
ncbi:MAG: hypothetical protein LBD16_02055 [Oscillospiraceae bacterium]|nr:hypothetical protein [Oscillospiraceae bacterium]